ncbi:MAG: division/cell wall cluster transcriptional repressor MraZ [Acidimicrobiales bacterium]|nr:division/cell wall cluster transcriptional repressor MraZ [Acidimicrobiales bacterium]
MFVGTFEHSLDDKGRLVLPSVFRSHLAERGFVSQYERCLGLWTEEGFAEVAKRLQAKVREGKASHNAVRAFAANATEVRPDSQGRITIPPRLRTYAGLERDVVIIGALDRIEIWDASRWRDVSSAADDSLTNAVTELGI